MLEEPAGKARAMPSGYPSPRKGETGEAPVEPDDPTNLRLRRAVPSHGRYSRFIQEDPLPEAMDQSRGTFFGAEIVSVCQ